MLRKINSLFILCHKLIILCQMLFIFIIVIGMFQVEIKKAEPRDSNKMNDVGANQWGMNQNNHLAMGVCF